jgi:WD40 repeat protein
MPRTTASAAILGLATLCASAAGQPPGEVPMAEGVRLPQALASAELHFSKAGDKLLVVRHYAEGTAPLVTVHDVKRDQRSIYFPLSSPDLISTAHPDARRFGVSAGFSPDGSVMVTTAFRAARLWDVGKGHNGFWPTPVALDLPGSALAAFTKDGKQLLTASLAGGEKQKEQARFEVRLWDVGARKWAGEPGTVGVPGRIGPRPTLRGLALAPDGASFLTAAGSIKSDAESVQLWDANTLKPAGEPLPATGSAYRFGPDGKSVLAVSRREVALWDVTARKLVCALPTPEVAKNWPSPLFDFRSRPWVAVHPSGTGVLYRQGNQVKLWDLDGGKPVEKLAMKHPGPVYWVAVSHDGKLAATACEGPNEILVWTLETGKPLLRVPHPGLVKAMEFSPDGRLLATADAGDVHLWNLGAKN